MSFYILTVNRGSSDIRIQVGACMNANAVFEVLLYALNRNEFVSFLSVNSPLHDRGREELDAAVEYLEEALGVAKMAA